MTEFCARGVPWMSRREHGQDKPYRSGSFGSPTVPTSVLKGSQHTYLYVALYLLILYVALYLLLYMTAHFLLGRASSLLKCRQLTLVLRQLVRVKHKSTTRGLRHHHAFNPNLQEAAMTGNVLLMQGGSSQVKRR